VRPISAPSFLPLTPLSFRDITSLLSSVFSFHPTPLTQPKITTTTVKMPSLDATLTWALPVHVAQLGAHVEAYIESLPALNALRACNRFGKGPQCSINKLPVELVQSIAHYHILPIRSAKLKQWMERKQCYEGDCELIEHWDRRDLVMNYWEHNSPLGHASPTPEPPDSEQLDDFCYEAGHFPDDIHNTRRESWEARLREFRAKDCPLFRKHFGLDVWLSRVCLGTSWGTWTEEAAYTTITYLVLPDRAVHVRGWNRHMTEDGYVESDYESGYGMAVSMNQHASANDIQKFNRVMSALDLDVFVHDSQNRDDTVLCASIKGEEQTRVDAENAASYPRPMFLVRSNIEGE
jgi:hypothetical protein